MDTQDYLKSVDERLLLAEIERREATRKELARLDRRAKANLFIKHRDILAQLLKHDRTSCATFDNSFYHPDHGGAACSLCALQALYKDQDDVEINLSLSLAKVKDE